MDLNPATDLQSRLEAFARTWRVDVEEVVRTATSAVAFGRRGEQPVVLKVARHPGEEWISGQVVDAFEGRGVVRALEHAGGAVLMERLLPGTSLASEAVHDDEATAILADVIGRMAPGRPPVATPTVESWGKAFEGYLARGGSQIPRPLVEAAQSTYWELCASQGEQRLLHGDLHHQNVLRDSRHGWLAIDPKGVVGELAYEVGASLRNPCARPELFAASATIQKRADCFTHVLRLDRRRILRWAFAQAILAAIWELEDDGVLGAGTGWIALAKILALF